MFRYNRAERRAQRARLILKRRKQNLRYGVSKSLDEKQWRYFDERVRARTGTLCSCGVCCNVRRRYGNSINGRTRAERLSLIDLKEVLCQE